MIEICTEDATADLAFCDAVQLGVVGIVAMQKWFADLAMRKGLSYRDQEIIDNCQGILAEVLTKLEDIVEDTTPPTTNPSVAPRTIPPQTDGMPYYPGKVPLEQLASDDDGLDHEPHPGWCAHPDNQGPGGGECNLECNFFDADTDELSDGECRWHRTEPPAAPAPRPTGQELLDKIDTLLAEGDAALAEFKAGVEVLNKSLKHAPSPEPPAAPAPPRYCTECDGGGEPLTPEGTCPECGADYGTIGDDLSQEQKDRLAEEIGKPTPTPAREPLGPSLSEQASWNDHDYDIEHDIDEANEQESLAAERAKREGY